jgi:CARDB protein
MSWHVKVLRTVAVPLFSVLLLVSPCLASSVVTVFGPKGFQRTAGNPNVFQEIFTATEGTGLLEVFNGGPSSGGQVTSGWVVLNGRRILGPDDFKKKDRVFHVPVVLELHNTLLITLASSPGTYLVARFTQALSFEEDTSGVIDTDLAVTNLRLSPDRCDGCPLISLQAVVTNLGREASGPATLVFTLDGGEVGRAAVNPLPAGASASFSVDRPAPGPGRHQVWARVEPGAGMMDRSPGNNSRLATLRVSGEALPVPELEYGPPQFDAGPPASISIDVQNPSFVDLTDIELWLSVSGGPLPQQGAIAAPLSGQICDVSPCVAPDATIESLRAGERKSVSFTWNYEPVGQYLVQLSAGNLPSRVPVEERIASWDLLFAGPIMQTVLTQPAWSSMGPYQITDETPGATNSGRISSLAIHPQDPNIIYAGGASLGLQITGTGLWKTMDGGQHWTALGDKFPQMNVMAIAIDPVDPDIVYCAGGVWRFDTPKPVEPGLPQPITGYILKSVDGGQHWALFGHPADGYSRLVVRRLAGDAQVVIYAASNRGVLRYTSSDPKALSSKDSEWSLILDGRIADVVVHPTDPSVVFAVRHDPAGQYMVQLDGLYRTKAGLTASGNSDWSEVLGFWQKVSDRQMFVDLFRANPHKVHLLTWDPQGGYQLRVSVNDGDDFGLPVYSFPNLGQYQCQFGPMFLRAHPEIDDLVYTGCGSPQGHLFKMYTAAGTWYHSVIPDIHPDQHAMEFFPDSSSYTHWGYVLGNDGGVYRAKYQTLWNLFWWDDVESINNGLVSVEYYDAGFDVSRIDPNVMVGGTQDNGFILYQPVSPYYDTWKSESISQFGDATAAVIAPSEPSTMYGKDNSGLHSHILRSTTGGAIWEGTKHAGLVNDVGGPIFTDPEWAKTIYVGGAQVQQSTNGGDNWYQIGPSSTQKQGDVVQVLRDTGVLFGSILYAGTAKFGQLWAQYWDRSEASPYPWQLVHEHPDPDAYVASMALAPNNADVLFVVYGNCTKDKRLRRFQFDYGAGNWGPGWWTSDWITGNLPEIHATTNTRLEVYTIAAHPTDDSTVFVGTDKGVYRGTVSAGAWAWTPFNNNLPLVAISKLISVPTAGEIRASTIGRGVWRVNLTTYPCPLCD